MPLCVYFQQLHIMCILYKNLLSEKKTKKNSIWKNVQSYHIHTQMIKYKFYTVQIFIIRWQSIFTKKSVELFEVIATQAIFYSNRTLLFKECYIIIYLKENKNIHQHKLCAFSLRIHPWYAFSSAACIE